MFERHMFKHPRLWFHLHLPVGLHRQILQRPNRLLQPISLSKQRCLLEQQQRLHMLLLSPVHRYQLPNAHQLLLIKPVQKWRHMHRIELLCRLHLHMYVPVHWHQLRLVQKPLFVQSVQIRLVQSSIQHV
jgi:hypothetical protein